MKYLDYAPIIFVSAQTGQRLEKLLGVIVQVATARQLRVGTAEMNRFVRELDLDRLPLPRHKPMRLYYLTQAGVAPPIFIAFTNRAGKLHFSVERFLENRIRERFGFAGTPMTSQPAGTTIGPGQYLTLYADNPNATSGAQQWVNRPTGSVLYASSIAVNPITGSVLVTGESG